MQEKKRRKDKFLAMLAYELRSPLAPIRTAVDIIRSPKADAAKVAWACEVAERQIHHMSRLLDDLLDLAFQAPVPVELDRRAFRRESRHGARDVRDQARLKLGAGRGRAGDEQDERRDQCSQRQCTDYESLHD